MLAVCLGRHHGFEHYYTSSGKWFTGMGVKTLFVVHRFAEPQELEPVMAELPAGDVSLETINALHDLGHGPSRMAGAPLLRKMLRFTQASEAVYQANAGTLDASSAFIGDPANHRYLTLHEIADLLLPSSIKVDGKYEAAALYAVHRAILQDEVFFRPLMQTGHRRSYLYEVSPLNEVQTIERVKLLVRDYLETPVHRRQGTSRYASPTLTGFIEKAQKAIDQSRLSRKPSTHGIIGPSTSSGPPALEATQWTSSDIEVLKFLEMWAGYQKFPNFSRFQCIGSAIIRSLERYEDQLFNATAGWTLLQEVGWITPWEIQARYGIRFPDVQTRRTGGFDRPDLGELEAHVGPDAFENRRRVWSDMTAYCIDAESTTEIDDGVSVERTSNPNEFWIHVHVADPASCIQPGTPIAQYAQLIPETVYLQGHYSRMLPDKVGADRFSLGPDRPCLTISALVDREGALLDRKITPAQLGEVVYMTPESVNDALGETRRDPLATGDPLTVGPVPEPKPPQRAMTLPQQLTAQQKEDLGLLSQLGKAIQKERLRRGAMPLYQSRAQPQVFLDYVKQAEVENSFIKANGDPTITVSVPKQTGTDLVENTMRLAGEVAAQWCNERGIPVLYRTQPGAPANAALIHQYTRDVFYPLLEAGIRPTENQWRHLRILLGGDDISTTPGPYFTMGVDMYTKATSPLRRYSDLVVHWQIEAALLEEMERGESLVGNRDDSFLPFTREALDRELPMMRLREKQIRSLNNHLGANQWILQAVVRAWEFREAPLPETFDFTVTHVSGRNSLLGRIDLFDRPASMRSSAMNNVAKMADVKVDDVFKVKLLEVNVHANNIAVEAVELARRAAVDTPGTQQPAASATA